MIVQHNLPALNSNRNLGLNNKGLSENLQKLSSGYKINKSADNAAGLAVSEKMRSQITGLNQAVRNTSDGISLVQTFEGAMSEEQAILQRMKTLAVQSANGTYDNDVDRTALMLEFTQMANELDQIADTDFNGIVMLNGGRMADGHIVDEDSVIHYNADNRTDTPNMGHNTVSVPNAFDAADRNFLYSETLVLQNGARAKDIVNYILSDVVGEGINAFAPVDSNANVFKYVYGTWLEDAVKVIADRAGLDVTNNFTLHVNFEYDNSDAVAWITAYPGKGYDQTPSLTFNLKYIDPNGNFKTPDGTELQTSAGLYMDRLLTHELTHALMYLNTKVTNIPLWYTEGMAEAVQGHNRYSQNITDWDLDGTPYSPDSDNFKSATTWSTMNSDIQAMTVNMNNAHVYDAGYLFVSWLDNYSSGGGSGSRPNGGGIADVSAALAGLSGATFDTAIQNVFGKTQAALLAEFKAESAAAATSQANYANWLDTKLNIQMNDGKQDALKNTDAGKSEIVPNAKVGEDVDEVSDVVTINGKDITLKWNAKGTLPYASFIAMISDEAARHKFALMALTNKTISAIGDLTPDLNCSAYGLGITDFFGNMNLTLETQAASNYAIDQIDFGINKISRIRAAFGAVQNRLEHKIDNLNVSKENMTASESRIRDTDMASEYMDFIKNQLLSEASKNMLGNAMRLPSETVGRLLS